MSPKPREDKVKAISCPSRTRTGFPIGNAVLPQCVFGAQGALVSTVPSPISHSNHAAMQETVPAAVTRQTIDGKHPEGLVPEECISMEEALTGCTLGAAFAGGVEDDFGTLEPGKFADIVILDTDILSQPPSALLTTQVSLTMVGAKTVYDAGTLKTVNRREDREN